MSRKKEELKKEFEGGRSADAVLQRCESCGLMLYYRMMDRHHPCGKSWSNILRYIYLCRECHTEVHNNPREATRRGLLWPGRNTREITDEEWAGLLVKIREHRHYI